MVNLGLLKRSRKKTTGLSRFPWLIPACVETARIVRAPNIASNAMQVLRAGRADPGVLRETRRILGELPEGVANKFMRLYTNRDPSDRRVKSKYYDLPVHISHAVWQARELGLYETERPLRIVDLGTGFGYFPLVCDSIGHEAVGLDWDRWKVYESISDDIRINRIEWVVTPEKPMPVLDGPVDMVTAFRPVFYYEFETDSLWDQEKWSIFLKTIKKNMHSDGAIYIGENKMSQNQQRCYEAMVTYFKSLGAKRHINGWLFDNSFRL